ncbi:MAG: molybdopterin-dependent aldehyde oxidoreductase [Coriobacteriales bacterium]
MPFRKMFLTINGAERMIVCDPENDTLAMVLRRMGFTGVKIGCGKGMCGACNVIMDGKVVRSCVRKMKNVPEFSHITTIEGIGTPNNLHPLQLAWIACGGVQCGFCTPGFIVTAKALLDENPDPTREEVRAWFQKNRNACRCTGYKFLVDAVMEAAKVMRGEMTMEDLMFKMPEDQRIYGTNYPRPDALSKVTGTADYGADLAMKLPEGVLRLAMVQSDQLHAKIVSIDTSKAEAMPGVDKVITAKDVPGSNKIFFPDDAKRVYSPMDTRPIICDKQVARIGDVVAVVAADTEQHARDAAAAVEVVYEPLAAYTDALDAIDPDAERVHPESPNLFEELPVMRGEDTRDVFARSAHVLEHSYHSQCQPHMTIEPECALVYTDEDGMLTVHTKSLFLSMAAMCTSDGLGIPADKLREIENHTGASFGYSLSPGTFAVMAAAHLATGKPCSMVLNYAEHTRWTGKRSPSYTNLKMAADENGKLTAMDFVICYDKGAYVETSDVAARGRRFMGAPYYIPNVAGISEDTYTNNDFSTAFRGFGSPQVYTASEQMMDELAEECGMDPLEFRYINVYREGDTSINGHGFSCYPMAGLIDKMRPYYLEKKKEVEEFNATHGPEVRRGVGVSCAHYNCSAGPGDHAEAAVELREDGGVNVYDTWEEQGQGGTIGTLVHAHESLREAGFVIDPKDIHLILNDTKIDPISGAAAASRSNYMVGNAIKDACTKLVDAMRKDDGTLRTYDEMKAEGIEIKYLGVWDTSGWLSPIDDTYGQGNPSPEYTYGFYVTTVEVDTTTGKTKCLSMHGATDVGVVSTRQGLEGQAMGGMAQSIGFALSEDYSDPKTQVTLLKMGFPYIEDIPDDLEVICQETPRPTGPHGSSGASEVYLSGAHVSVINAIYNAIGVRIRQIPATPDKILAGLEAKKKGEPFQDDHYWLGEDLHQRLKEFQENPM